MFTRKLTLQKSAKINYIFIAIHNNTCLTYHLPNTCSLTQFNPSISTLLIDAALLAVFVNHSIHSPTQFNAGLIVSAVLVVDVIEVADVVEVAI